MSDPIFYHTWEEVICMRIYEVEFHHTRYGARWSASRVAVRGFAKEAMKKALRLQNGQARHMRVSEVRLIAATTD